MKTHFSKEISWLDFIFSNQVIGFFDEPIRLRSGKMSHWYVNWRSVARDVYLMDQLTEFVLDFVEEQGLSPDCFFGVAEGASKLGILAQYKWAKRSKSYAKGSHCLPMGRGKPKEHGAPADRYFLGEPQGQTIVLEDVTTTGGALLKSIEHLRSFGVPILAAISLTDRMQQLEGDASVRELLKAQGVPFFAMSEASSLLPVAIERNKPGPEIEQAIREEVDFLPDS